MSGAPNRVSRTLAAAGVIAWLIAPLVWWSTINYPTTLPRVAWCLLAGALLISSGWWARKQKNIWQLNFFDLAGIAWLLFLVISSWRSLDPATAWWSEAGRGMGVVWLVVWFSSYVVARQIDWSPRERRWCAGLWAGVLLVFAAASWLIPFDFRLAGLFGNAMITAAFLVMGLFWVWWLWLRRQSWGLTSSGWKWFLLLTAAALSITLWFTRTRAAVLGLAIGAVVGVVGWWLSGRKNAVGWKQWAVLVGFLLVALGVVAGVFITRPEIRATRWYNWSVALTAFQEKPVLGWGWDNYRLATEKNYRPELGTYGFYETRVDKPHNIFLEILVTGGAVGFLFYILFWGGLVWWGYKNYQGGFWTGATWWSLVGWVTGYFAMQFFGFDTPATLIPWWLLFLFVSIERPSRLVARLPNWLGYVVVLPLTVFLVWVVWYGAYLPVRQGKLIEAVQVAAEKAQFASVEDILHTSYSLPAGPYAFEQWRWMTDSLLGGVAFGTANTSTWTPAVYKTWTEQRDFLGQETKRWLQKKNMMANWQLFGGRAAYYLFAAGAGQEYLGLAERAFQRAEQLAPQNQEAQTLEALVAIEKKQIDRALQLFLTVMAAGSPEAFKMSDLIVSLLLTEKRSADIVTVYETMVAHPSPYEWYVSKKADYYARLAAAYAAVGRVSDARLAVTNAVAADPSFAAEAEIFLKTLK